MRVTGHTRMARWGGAILVALAPLPWLGLGTASATDAPNYATVSGHEAFTEDANHPDYWGDNCADLAEGANQDSYVLTQNYAKVIVKAGAGEFANTIFLNASEGETVWADTNGDGVYNPGGPGGDKQISHIIVCGGGGPVTTEPEPTDTTTEPEPTDTTTEPEPTDTTTEPEPTDTTTEPEPTDTTTEPEPTDTTTEPEPTDTTTEPEPSVTETGSSEPGDKDPSKEATVEATRLTQPAALPATGSGMPIGTALAISMLLIGLGALLLIGPGRLVTERYHRKH